MAESETEVNGPYDPSAFDGPAMRRKRDVPDGLWMRCTACENMLFRKTVTDNMGVCPKCQHHFEVTATERVGQLTDPGTFEELFVDIGPADPLQFEWGEQTYARRIKVEQEKTGNIEACLTGVGYIKGRRVALGVMDGTWLRGSMGSVVGEKITLIIEEATKQSLPLVIISASGGARMH